MEHTPEYSIWAQMKNRCENANWISYANYGGRGIKVCDRWRDSFEAFYEDVGPRPPGMRGKRPLYSLGRKDNDGNYEPGNVEWQTPEQQNRNTRATRFVVVDGKKLSLMDACERFGITRSTFYSRLAHGALTDEDALKGR